MSKMKNEPTGEYQVIDNNGSARTVTIFTSFTKATPLAGASQWGKGSSSHKLKNGDHINPNPDGTVEHVVSGQIWRKV